MTMAAAKPPMFAHMASAPIQTLVGDCELRAVKHIQRLVDVADVFRTAGSRNGGAKEATRRAAKKLSEIAKDGDLLGEALFESLGRGGVMFRSWDEDLVAMCEHFAIAAVCWEHLEVIARASDDPDKLHVVAIRAAAAAKRWNRLTVFGLDTEVNRIRALTNSFVAYQQHGYEMINKERWLDLVCLIGEMADRSMAAGASAEQVLLYAKPLLIEAQKQKQVGHDD